MNKMCGNCSGDHKFADCPFVERKVTKEELTRLTDKAEAYDRLLPWILHVLDCYECHKKGTDVCDWTRDKLKKDNDIEIVVLPDNIEDARKALEDMK